MRMYPINEDKLNQLVGKMLGDLGGAFSVPTVRMGLRLGLFDALLEAGPLSSEALAKKAGWRKLLMDTSIMTLRTTAFVCRRSRL